MSLWYDDRIEVVTADITTLSVDVIVNAANESLLGGGGVDGAIHRAAGPELLAECRTLGGASPGDVKLTGGYLLPAGHVAHAVGPVWYGGEHGEDQVLASCYRRSLALAADVAAATIAFPAISTGVYCFPLARATRVAIRTVREVLSNLALPRRVVFCCFSEGDHREYEKAATEIFGATGGGGRHRGLGGERHRCPQLQVQRISSALWIRTAFDLVRAGVRRHVT